MRSLPLFLVALIALAAAPAAAAPDEVDEEAELEEAETDDLPDEAERELARAEGEPLEEAELSEQDRPREDVEFDDFYGELSAQGTWIETEDHGWAWVPYRQAEVDGWRPYLYGQWVWTRWGWTWVSEEPFGWATYHYGRWAWTDGWGWSWVPGYTWGPAWVVWRSSDEAIGWAPLYPGYVTYSDSYPYHQNHWVFVGSTHFYCHPIHNHWYHDHVVISHHYHRSHWNHHWHHVGSSRHRVYAGPTRSHVERVGATRVRSTRIEPSSRPVEQGLRSSGKPGEVPARVSEYRPAKRSAVEGAARPRVAVPRAGDGARVRAAGSGLDSRTAPARSPSLGGAPRRSDVAVDRPGGVDAPRRSSPGRRGDASVGSTAGRSGPAVRDAPPGRSRGSGYRAPGGGSPSYRRPSAGGAGRGPSIGGGSSGVRPSGGSPVTSPAKPKVGKGGKGSKKISRP